jgi:hypothetical protein
MTSPANRHANDERRRRAQQWQSMLAYVRQRLNTQLTKVRRREVKQ